MNNLIHISMFQIDTCTEGYSLMPLIRGDRNIQWKTAVFSQYPRMAVDGNIYMGYTINTERYRYLLVLPYLIVLLGITTLVNISCILFSLIFDDKMVMQGAVLCRVGIATCVQWPICTHMWCLHHS